MRDHAPTIIHCPTPDEEYAFWQAIGETRGEAEASYRDVIETGALRKPAYRIIVQYKVDQHPFIAGGSVH